MRFKVLDRHQHLRATHDDTADHKCSTTTSMLSVSHGLIDHDEVIDGTIYQLDCGKAYSLQRNTTSVTATIRNVRW